MFDLDEKIMIVALLTAGGVGSRMNLSVPKQFMILKGKPLIAHTLEKFQQAPFIDEICLVCLAEWLSEMKEIVKRYGFTKVKLVVPGGKNGQESIFNGLKELRTRCDDNDIVIIHDGNRPLVSFKVLAGCIETVKAKGNAITSIPVVEAVLITDNGEDSVESIDRKFLRRTQTPHGFYFKDIYRAHLEANEKGIRDTIASCTLLQALGQKVYFCDGEERNLKITTPEDIEQFLFHHY